MAVPVGHRLYAADPGAFAANIASSPTIPQAVRSAPGAKFWVHTTRNGTRLTTGIYNISGDPVPFLTADDQGFIPFWAPPAYGTLWLQPLSTDGTPLGIFSAVWPADLADVVKNFTNSGVGVDDDGYLAVNPDSIVGTDKRLLAELDGATKTVFPTRLGTGTRNGAKYLRDDGTWATPPSATPLNEISEDDLDVGDALAVDDVYTFEGTRYYVRQPHAWTGTPDAVKTFALTVDPTKTWRLGEPDLINGFVPAISPEGVEVSFRLAVDGGGDPPPDVPDPLFSWVNPTALAGTYWPSETTPTTSWGYGPRQGDSQIVTDAFGAGRNGVLWGTDGHSVNFSDEDDMTFLPDNELHNLLVFHLRDISVDVDPSAVPRDQWIARLFGWNGDHNALIWRIALQLHNDGTDWSWVINGPQGSGSTLGSAVATQTPGSFGLPGPLFLAIDFCGANSALIIQDDGGTRQTIPFNATGISAWHHLNTDPFEGGTWRGPKVAEFVKYYANMDADTLDALLTDIMGA